MKIRRNLPLSLDVTIKDHFPLPFPVPYYIEAQFFQKLFQFSFLR